MKFPPIRIAFVLAAIAATAITLDQGDLAFLRLIAAAVFILIALTQPENEDTLILLLASGEILVIAVTAASFFPGVVVQCAVIGAAFSGSSPDKRDRAFFVIFCVAAIGGAVILDRANQSLLPFAVITALVAAVTFVFLGVQEMKERRMFRGVAK